jgi:hypothetical protein
LGHTSIGGHSAKIGKSEQQLSHSGPDTHLAPDWKCLLIMINVGHA